MDSFVSSCLFLPSKKGKRRQFTQLQLMICGTRMVVTTTHYLCQSIGTELKGQGYSVLSQNKNRSTSQSDDLDLDLSYVKLYNSLNNYKIIPSTELYWKCTICLYLYIPTVVSRVGHFATHTQRIWASIYYTNYNNYPKRKPKYWRLQWGEFVLQFTDWRS